MNKGNAATMTREAPAKADTVVFVSPSERLVINLQLKPQRKFVRDNVVHVDEERVQCQFAHGQYETSDKRIIELLRLAPNNVDNIESVGDALNAHKDRFYETSAKENAA